MRRKEEEVSVSQDEEEEEGEEEGEEEEGEEEGEEEEPSKSQKDDVADAVPAFPQWAAWLRCMAWCSPLSSSCLHWLTSVT